MNRAFTLPELVLVLAVAGILLVIALPGVARVVDQVMVDAATSQLVAAHRRARIMAITRGQTLTLAIDSAETSISPRSGVPVLWTQTGPSGSGVSLHGPTRRFTFAPEGMTVGLSNASLELSRGSSTRTIVISRLGRIRVHP